MSVTLDAGGSEERSLQAVKDDKATGIRATFTLPKSVASFFKYAKKAKALRSIDLAGTAIDDSVSKAIAEVMLENPSITYLALRGAKLEKGLVRMIASYHV
jgi:hypothetical protein